MRSDWLVSEDNINYRAYGIDIFEENKLIKSIKDISLNKNAVDELVSKCNTLKVSILHIEDVIQDFVQLCFLAD